MTATQVEYASVIRQSGKDLLSLLNNILDLAKVESGTATIDLAPVHIDDVRTALLREFAPVAREKGLELSVAISPGCPEQLQMDERRLGQILRNLLVNALKFTERGTVSVRFGALAGGWGPAGTSVTGGPSGVAITVSDTGVGVAGDQQQRIFEPFAQGDGSSARMYGGTGLGLSISRELAGLLGGEITLVSELGVGSTFTVHLPGDPVKPVLTVVPATADRPLPFPSPADEAPAGLLTPDRRVYREFQDGRFEGLKVLVVDDDYRNVFAMTALLERGGVNVLAAESGHDALGVLDRMPDIDIVLMDIMMPVMDGYATIRAIRAIDAFSALPIIAVTGKVMAGERERCLDAGANAYVPKPVDTADILAVLTPWLKTIAQPA